MTNTEIDVLIQAMADLDELHVMQLVQEISQESSERIHQALNAFQLGMAIVSDRFDRCEYFVGDLIYAGDIMSSAISTLKLALEKITPKENTKGKVLLCTVEGDIHDIGKNIVKTVLDAENIEVVDLGVNVPPEKVVQSVLAEGVWIVALSGVLSFAVDSMKRTVEALRAASVPRPVRIIIGGACINEKAFRMIGADAWAISAQDTVSICTKWLEEENSQSPA